MPSKRTPRLWDRVVYYPLNLAAKNGQPYPAVISHVWSDNDVNIVVLADPMFPLDRKEWTGMVPFSDEPGVPGTWTWSWPQ